uniref:Ribosomal RNA small subunit methyltransferase I n=1 Tax=Desulfacinum infernum TaxID=35837 RepID=A0A831ZIY0_9BACT
MSGEHSTEEGAGTLYVVATPIGNLADITLRALEVLRSVAFVVAEDTRHTRKLLSAYQIRVPVLSCHAHTAPEGLEKIVGILKSGRSVALVTDAGTPGISDPGTALIHLALENGRPVVPVPGPSAVITALSVSGLPPQPFAFLGFPPPKGGRRTKFFEEYGALAMTLVLYESPRRLGRTLQDILHHWGNRRVAVARELTKVHEEVFRGTVSQAVEAFREPTRGEVTLVVEGASALSMPKAEAEGWKEALAACLARGETVKEAVEKIHRAFKVRRREVYRTALELDRDRD